VEVTWPKQALADLRLEIVVVGSGSVSIEVAISGDLTIRSVDALQAELSTAIHDYSEIILNITDVVEADLTFVQLVEAARKSAAQQDKALRLSGPVGGDLRAMLERGGFLDDSAADRSRFWLEGAMRP
jgi:anti-anti-sigma regulatory factor